MKPANKKDNALQNEESRDLLSIMNTDEVVPEKMHDIEDVSEEQEKEEKERG